MYFSKNEIIELEGKIKYLILDTALIDEVTYYKVQEVDQEDKKLINGILYITATNIEGKLYINFINNKELIKKLDELLN